ncbi:MAG TPA: hypothetical protein VGG05_13620 [Pseudonocardiaceae bacterium]
MVAVAVRAAGVEARRGKLSTPTTIGLPTGAVVVPAVLLGIVVAAVIGSLGSGFDQLSQRSAPQVTSAADRYVALSGMDAQVANVLLVGDDAGLSDNRAHALTVYDQGRGRADSDLQRVAAIGGNDPTVARGVTAILDRFGQYQALAGEALSLNAAGHDPSGHPSATELAVYRQATALTPALLSDTQSLIAASRADLDRPHTSTRRPNGSPPSAPWPASPATNAPTEPCAPPSPRATTCATPSSSTPAPPWATPPTTSPATTRLSAT